METRCKPRAELKTWSAKWAGRWHRCYTGIYNALPSGKTKDPKTELSPLFPHTPCFRPAVGIFGIFLGKVIETRGWKATLVVVVVVVVVFRNARVCPMTVRAAFASSRWTVSPPRSRVAPYLDELTA